MAGIASLAAQNNARASKTRYYRPELDALRFLAFLLVFFHHTLPSARDPRVAHLLRGMTSAYDAITDACGYGLTLFFALSAFLICELLLREQAASGTIAIKQFYIRRILRIWPLYYLGLVLGLLFALPPASHSEEIVTIGWYSIFMGSWYIVTHGAKALAVSPLWSISVEEQFYLFAPWTIKFLNRHALYVFCALLILISNGWLFYLGQVSAVDHRVWFNSCVEFECFAAGILLCLLLRGRIPGIALWLRILLVVCCLACWFSACFALHSRFGTAGESNPGPWLLMGGYALASLGCMALLLAFLGVNERMLPKWLIYLGRISFGLYVYHSIFIYLADRYIIQTAATIHTPLVSALKGPIFLIAYGSALGLTIVTASISYRYFETPFLKMKRRHGVIESEPVGAVDGGNPAVSG